MWIKHCCFYLGRPALKGNAANLGDFIILGLGGDLILFIYSLLAVLGLLLSELFSGCSDRGATLWLRCTDFSLWWLLLLRSSGSGACGPQEL